MEREVFLVGRVEEGAMKDIGQKILGFYNDNPSKEITLYITSDGGNPNLAIAFYDFIKIKNVFLVTVALGECNSSALTVLLAGHRRECTKNTLFLEHQLTRSYDKGASFNPLEMMALAENMKTLAESLRRIMVKETGQSIEAVKDQENKELIMTAEEAKEFGLIHEII